MTHEDWIAVGVGAVVYLIGVAAIFANERAMANEAKRIDAIRRQRRGEKT